MFLHLANAGKTVDLETAAVGKDRLGPVHETVQAAGLFHDIHARTDVQMIGVAQNDLRAHLRELAVVERLDTGLGADGHEDRRFHHTTRRRQATAAGTGFRIRFEQFEHLAIEP